MPRASTSQPSPVILETGEDQPIPCEPVSAGKLSFFERLKQIPEEEWDRYSVYIYRRWPRIAKSDQPHYIDVVRQPIDEPWLLENFGSGKYTLRLNNPRKTIETYVCEVHSLDKPPKLDPAELVDCPENERYRTLWPEKHHPKTEPTTTNGSGDSVAVGQLINLVNRLVEQKNTGQPESAQDRRLTESLVQWALQQAAEERSSSSPGKLTELVQALKQLAPPPPPPSADPAATLEKLASVVEKLAPKPAPEKDTLSEIEKIIAVMDRLRPATNAVQPSEPAEVSTWERVGTLFVNLLQPAMPTIGSVLAAKFFGSASQSPNTITGHPVTADTSSVTQTPKHSDSPENTSPAGQQPVPDSTSPELAQARQLILAGGNVIIAKLRQGVKGYEFADLLIAMYGKDVWAYVARFGPEKMLELLQSVPPVWSQIELFGREYLLNWCREFVDYERLTMEESDESEEVAPRSEA